MDLKAFLEELDDAAESLLSSEFEIEITDTKFVPHFDDSYITFDNVEGKTKKCKRLESCVLYVDIRNSASISSERQPKTLAKLYSAFVRSMIKAAKYHNGHVRNIIGDRVMVVFDRENCFTNAVNTAILMNSVGKYIIDKHFAGEFKCGIGIDYGTMLVTKAGEIRHGAQTEFYRSLVWLGRPANIASRMTDLANKTLETTRNGVHSGNYYPYTEKWIWSEQSYPEFLSQLEVVHPPAMRHKDPYFRAFFTGELSLIPTTYPPILMTKEVFEGFAAERPADDSITNKWWSKQNAHVKEYNGDTYGGDVIFTAAEDF